MYITYAHERMEAKQFQEFSVETLCEGPLVCFMTKKNHLSELRQHLQHVDADLLRVIIQPSADDAKAGRRQDAAMQLVGLILLVLFIFLIRYLLHADL